MTTRTAAIETGRLTARLARGVEDLAPALALRAQVFRAGAPDRDAQDDFCQHVLVERAGRLVATFRLRPFPDAARLGEGYAGQRYDLRGLASRGGVMAELGRFCTAPGEPDPDVIRLAWASMTRLLEGWGADFLFGCASFPGTDPQAWSAPLGLLAGSHLAPADWAPGPVAAEVFAIRGLAPPADPTRAMAGLPPLLRSYLALGARVSDHAVIDRELGTFHLFTGLDLSAIPPARAARLRDMARDLGP